MQIVIDIPSAMYKDIVSGKDGYSNYVHTAVRIGTPLPKGHGRLIDADKLNRKDLNCANVPMNFIDIAPTIIEADAPDINVGSIEREDKE